MFEKYTEKTRRVIFFARYEASQFGSPTIETEHLLLGLVREDKGLVKLLLPGGAEDAIREAIEKVTLKGEKISTSVDMPVSEESKRVLIHAVEESTALSQEHIGTEHLLLGLLHEKNTLACRLLTQFGLKLEEVRRKVAKLPQEAAAMHIREHVAAKSAAAQLSDFGADLTKQAADGALPPLIGRERELEQLVRVLCCRGRRNSVLIGEPGVGKQAIVRGLAQRIAEGTIPDGFDGKSIISLDLQVIVSGVHSRRHFEESLENITGSLQMPGAAIFFVEDLHALAVSKPVCLLVANVLKAAMLSQAVQCISTATQPDYQNAIAKERWLEQLFQTVEVAPLDEEQTMAVLQGAKGYYEQFHGVTYTEEALRYAIFHSSNYILRRNLPEKAIDLIDEAGAQVKIRRRSWPREINEAQARLRLAADRHQAALSAHEFETARYYADEEKKLQEELQQLFQQHGVAEIEAVTRDDIEEIVSQWTGIPLASIRASRLPSKEN